MKNVFATILLGASVILAGCNQGTSGGPGASSPPAKTSMTGQTEDTFSLAVPSVKLNQGEAKSISVGIKRGKNFSEDVSLNLAGLPKGVSLDPGNLAIKHGDSEVKLTLKAADDAALGDFTVKVTGHPAKGADGSSDLKITIAKQEPKEVANAAGDAVKAKWDEYMAAMQTQLDQFTVKYAELKDRAAKAEGQAKADLDAKLAAAKTKLDAASAKLGELRAAGADRWESVKEGTANAFDDLKNAFE